MSEPHRADSLASSLANRVLHEAHLIKQEVRALGHIDNMPLKAWREFESVVRSQLKSDGLLTRILRDKSTGYVDIFVFKYHWVMELFEQAEKLPRSDLMSDVIKGLLFGYSLREINRLREWKSGCVPIHEKKDCL